MRLFRVLLLMGLALGPTRAAVADPGKPGEPAVQDDPTYTEGVNAVKRGNYAAAIPLFEAVIAKDNRNANAYNWLAYSTRQSGDAAKAIPIYQKALAIDPNFLNSHFGIAAALTYQGKSADALAELQKMTDKARSDGERRSTVWREFCELG